MENTIMAQVDDEEMLFTQAVANNEFLLSEEEILAKLELSRMQASQGKYRDADDVVADMRKKYKL